MVGRRQSLKMAQIVLEYYSFSKLIFYKNTILAKRRPSKIFVQNYSIKISALYLM